MKYRVLVIAIVICLLGLATALAYAQNVPTPTGTPSASSVIQQDIFVRGGPGRDYLPVGKLLAGDRIRPLSRNAQGDWVLIIYGKSFGWIRRDLAFWVENIDALPVIDVANLTPSPVVPTTPTNTPLLLPTSTPIGNWVNLDGDAQSGFVRAGPGRTYLRLGQLLTGDSVVPVSRSTDGSWIMIRYGDGFGWVSRSLVLWVDNINIDVLPVVLLDNLTPSATYTATLTPSATSTFTPTSTFTATFTLTSSPTPTRTPSQTATFTPTATFTQTLTSTPLPTVTPTLVPSATYTNVPTHTSTVIPSATVTLTTAPSATHTLTLTATNTATIAPTSTLIPSETPSELAVVIVSSATMTSTPTLELPTITPTASLTSTLTATAVPPTATYTPTATVTLTNTPTLVANIVTIVITPSSAFTSTLPISTNETTPSPTTTLVSTQTATSVVRATLEPSSPTTGQATSNLGFAPEVIIAAVVLIAILVYAVLYWRGTSGSERYSDGFIIEICPVCQRGQLLVESRQERLMGIPRSRHSVRCTECRSVLREVSGQQWRYAVDPMENPDLYERFNGRIIDNQTLADLEHNLPQTVNRGTLNSSSTPPDFIDDDT